MTQQHAPEHVRGSFRDWLDDIFLIDPKRKMRGNREDIAPILDALENCTDTLPHSHCDLVDLPAGSTYGQAVEEIRRFLKQEMT